MKWCTTWFLLFLVICPTAQAEEPNTLIAIHRVELNNKNKPIKRTYFKRNSIVQVVNEQTQKIKSINQQGKAKALYLEPGRYCFKSFNVSGSQKVKILNPYCFDISGEAVTNLGTWVIGSNVSGSNWYALMIDIKQNHSEIESILGIKGSVPATIYKHQRLY